jgi:hypothetical protein
MALGQENLVEGGAFVLPARSPQIRHFYEWKELAMSKRPFGYCLSCAIVAMASPVLSATCAQRENVVERLQSRFSEQLTVGGLQRAQNSTSILEIWSSKETGTYTVLLTNPNGISCILAAGTDFFEVTRKPIPKGTAS